MALQVTEEALRTSKERLAFSQCRLHDLQTKLAEHVRMGHSPAAGLQIAARPEFYVKEMSNKVSLLKALQVRTTKKMCLYIQNVADLRLLQGGNNRRYGW